MNVTLHYPTLPDRTINLKDDGYTHASFPLDYTDEHGVTEKATHFTDDSGVRHAVDDFPVTYLDLSA